MSDPIIVRRLGVPPKNRPGALESDDNASCPDVLELGDGDFAVIGAQVEPQLLDEFRRAVELLDGVVDDTMQVVIIPRGGLGPGQTRHPRRVTLPHGGRDIRPATMVRKLFASVATTVAELLSVNY